MTRNIAYTHTHTTTLFALFGLVCDPACLCVCVCGCSCDRVQVATSSSAEKSSINIPECGRNQHTLRKDDSDTEKERKKETLFWFSLCVSWQWTKLGLRPTASPGENNSRPRIPLCYFMFSSAPHSSLSETPVCLPAPR